MQSNEQTSFFRYLSITVTNPKGCASIAEHTKIKAYSRLQHPSKGALLEHEKGNPNQFVVPTSKRCVKQVVCTNDRRGFTNGRS